MHHKLYKLRTLPEACLDRQAITIGKHRILAELSRMQDMRDARKVTLEEKAKLFAYRAVRKLMPAYQKVLALGLVIALTLSTGFIAQAAMPGDMLWSVKITMEKAEVVLALSAAQEGRVHMRHVDNRLKELAFIVSDPDTAKKNESISRLIRRLEKDITAAGQSLKVSKEEQQNSEPQLIIALAQDLSEKASEAAKTLEQNKKTLEEVSEASQGIEKTSTTPTTTDLIVTETLGSSSTTPSALQKTASSTDVGEELKVIQEPTVMDIITEVQLVNEYISYDAIRSLVDLVARGNASGSSREQATALLSQKIQEQEGRLHNLQKVTELINNDFLIHKKQAQALNKKASDTLKKANDNVFLGYLTQAMTSLSDAKVIIEESTKLLREVGSAGGFIHEEEEKKPLVTPKNPQPQTINIQSVEVSEPHAESTVDTSDRIDTPDGVSGDHAPEAPAESAP